MMSVLVSLLLTLRGCVRERFVLQVEVLALRHQLQVLERSRHPHRLRLRWADRVLWVALSRIWNQWRMALVIVKPEAVIAWHRQGFRLFWTWKCGRRVGRPTVPADVRALIRTMSEANPRWGAPRIHGELLKLGMVVCQAIRRQRGPANSYAKRSPGTRLPDMSSGIAITRSTDGRRRRRRWQLRKSSRRRVPHGRTGTRAVHRIRAARVPRSRHRVQRGRTAAADGSLLAYYERSRTHLSLDKDAPIPRPVVTRSQGCIVAIPQVGGLHHRYERRAA